MSKYLGTWLYNTNGDNTKTAQLKVYDDAGVPWGTAVGAGYTPYLEVRKAGDTSLLVTITGSWSDTPNETALFTIGTNATLIAQFTAGVTSVDYEAILYLFDGGSNRARLGADGNAEPFTFTMTKWPDAG